MKRTVLMMMVAACLGMTSVAEDIEEPVEVVKEKKEKNVKAPKVKKEKAPKPPKKEKAEKPPKKKPVVEDITLSGVVSKEEIKKGEKVSVKYVLTDTEGRKVGLSKAPKGVKLDDFVGAAVSVTGTGIKTEKAIKLKSVTSIEKSEGASDVVVFPADEPDDEEDDEEDDDDDDM